MKKILPILLLFLIVGCSSKLVSHTDLAKLQESETSEYSQLLEGKHKYLLEYLVDNDKYEYATYEIEGSYRYLQVLFKNNSLDAISKISLREVYNPEN